MRGIQTSTPLRFGLARSVIEAWKFISRPKPMHRWRNNCRADGSVPDSIAVILTLDHFFQCSEGPEAFFDVRDWDVAGQSPAICGDGAALTTVYGRIVRI